MPVQNPINSCLRIEQKRISRRCSIPDRISFNLNQEILSQINILRNQQQKISFSSDNLTELRYYFLLKCSKDSRLGITFTTHYQQSNYNTAIIKSVVYLSGKTQQYILDNRELCQAIVEAHYWLIEQILTQIPIKFHKSILLLWLISLGIVMIFFAPLILIFVPNFFWAKVLLLLAIAVVIFKILQYFRHRYLSSWLLEQLLFGIFSSSTKRRNIGLNLLSRFG